LGVREELKPPLSCQLIQEHLQPLLLKISHLNKFPPTTPLFRNFSNLGEGATSDLARLAEGSSDGLVAGLGCASAFLFRIGREVGIFLGLFSVDACSLSKTGDFCGTATGSRVLMGDPSDEDRISSITGGPYLVVLLLTFP